MRAVAYGGGWRWVRGREAQHTQSRALYLLYRDVDINYKSSFHRALEIVTNYYYYYNGAHVVLLYLYIITIFVYVFYMF